MRDFFEKYMLFRFRHPIATLSCSILRKLKIYILHSYLKSMCQRKSYFWENRRETLLTLFALQYCTAVLVQYSYNEYIQYQPPRLHVARTKHRFPILLFFLTSRTPSQEFYVMYRYNIWQDSGKRTRVATTAARCATIELHTIYPQAHGKDNK